MNRSSRIELALNVLAFATVIIVCGTYLATQAYHWKPLQDTKTAYVSLTDSNLILEDTGVFVSGIRIGKVADVRIKPDGATVVLEYDADNSLPADSVLSIGLQSALGEPYLNFTPGTSGGPSLKNGATIAAENLEEPESIPGIFNQISTMSSVFDAGPMSGILKSFAEALDGTEGSLDRITDGTALPHLFFTLADRSTVRELTDSNKEGLWARRTWEALRALDDYARYQLENPGTGLGLHEYLRQPPDGYAAVPVRRLASGESDSVRRRDKLSDKRIFPVPAEVDPSGEAPMFAHFRLDGEYGICARLYFLPDLGPGTTNRIYIGYIGRHLPVHSTN